MQHVYIDRGFGFIRCIEGPPEEIGQDYFFHMSGLEPGLPLSELHEAVTEVDFDKTVVAKGRRAERITRAA